jgi:hypothetical protein
VAAEVARIPAEAARHTRQQPLPRRTPLLLRPAVAADAHTEALVIRRPKEKRLRASEPFFLFEPQVLEPQVRRDLQDARVVCAGNLPERRADVLSTVVEILKFRMVEEIERINAKFERDALPIEWRHFR